MVITLNPMTQCSRILLLFMLCIINGQASAAVSAQLDSHNIYQGESLTLTLSSDEQNIVDPDLTPLHADFEVLSTSQSSQIRMVNGAVSAQKTWSITLMPKQVGTLTVPAITFGRQTTQPLTLEVLAANNTKRKSTARDIFLEVDISAEQVYVQAQLSYQIRLYHNGILQEGSLSKPEIPGAVIVAGENDRRFETTVNGRKYEVIERVYTIFPQNSGELVIPPVKLEGSVIDTGNQQRGYPNFGSRSFNRFFQTSRAIRLFSEQKTIQVLPKPEHFSGAWWIPARGLSIEQEWSGDIDNIVAGEPITRTITVRAIGLTGSQLPALDAIDLDGLKSYPDQPTTETLNTAGQIVGVRTEKVALVAQHAGNIELPALEIVWWDTAENREKIASLPAQTLHIGAGQNQPQAVLNTAPQILNTPQTSTAPTTDKQVNASPESTPIIVQEAGFWPWLAALLFGAWVATLALWLRQRRQPKIVQTASPTEPNLSEKKALHELAQAQQSGQARTIRDALLIWAKARWPDNPPLALGALAQRLPQQTPLVNAVGELDRHLYRDATQPWHNFDFKQAIQAIPRNPPLKPAKQRHTLAPLYPSSNPSS